MPEAKNLIQRLNDIGIVRHDHNQVIYKYMPIETALLMLQNRTLMFQRPDNFNDPFELHLSLMDFEFEADQAVKIYERYFNNGTAVSDPLRVELEKHGRDIISNSVKETFEKYRGNIGITCFSKNPSNALMWSHYASSHKGVCIGFIIQGWDNVKSTFSVNYAQSITPIKFFDENEKDLIFWYWTFTKSHVWSYEEEVRSVNMFSNGIQPFEDIIIQEIYYGVGMSVEDIRAIEGLLPGSIIKKAKMEINAGTFDLVQTNFP
ncbi:MAG: hypothetical protein JWQ38_2043 [Flavipsychrobacter sp.]|nr:hypothetical protein [Flavipsychrobacter sp.]